MLSKKVTEALNKQVEFEAASSQYYLAMASWAETQGLKGVAAFLFRQSDEERMHMLKLLKFINERGSHGLVPALKQPPANFKSISKVFDEVLHHEVAVTKEINRLVDITLKEKDYTTHNFLQWYVSEQIEEEAQARDLVDKLKMIGEDKGGLYLFDRDLGGMGAGAGGGQKGA